MNREIKFRLKVPSSEILSHEQCLERGYSWKVLNDSKHYIAMQFTGLKDRNGAEIYEGDIVRWSDNFEKRVFCYEVPVIFARGAWYLDTDESRRFAGSDMLFEIIHDEQENVEVIGNIYQNSDLVTASTTRADADQTKQTSPLTTDK